MGRDAQLIAHAEWCNLLAGRSLPCAVVDLDAFDRNIAAVAAHVPSGKTLRVATKSVRVPALLQRILAAGKPFSGLMTYAARETEFLASQGFDDFLLAYPVVRPEDLACVRRVLDSGKRIAVVVDSEEHLHLWNATLRGSRARLRVLIEADASLRLLGQHLGVRRSPVRSIAAVSRLLDVAAKLEGIQCVGAMVYEAQVAGLGDRNPFKRFLNPAAGLVRKLSVPRVARLRAEIAAEFARRGLRLEILNGGGSGSLDFTAREAAVTELTAGSAFYAPHLFDYYSNVRFEPACFFALPVVRRSDDGWVTCFGGGYVASGEPGWDRVPRPWSPKGLSLSGTEACGEVQTPLRSQGALSLGDPVLFRHAKAGELMEHFKEVLCKKGSSFQGSHPTYRGMGYV